MTGQRGRNRTTCRLPGCTRPTDGGGFVCADDMAEHAERLANLPLVAHALEDRFLRHQRFSVAGLGPRRLRDPDDPDAPQEQSPIPFDPRAGQVRRHLSRTLLRWTIAFQDVDPLGYPATLGYNRVVPTVEAMTAHIARHAHVIAGSVLGPQAVADIRDVHDKGLRAVDRPPDLVYLGICSMTRKVNDVPVECDEDLYAVWGSAHATCRTCHYQHDVKNRQAVLLAAVKDQLATASDISRGLSGLDVTVTAARIRQWKTRGRITPHGTTLNDSPLYRVGDVIDLALNERERIKAELRKATP